MPGITRNLRDGQIKLKDGTGTPLSVTLTLESGDLSWSVKQVGIQVLDRGVLDHVRLGDQQPVALSFTIKVDRVHEATSPVTVYNAFKKTGAAATWVSVGASHEVFMLKVEFTVLDPAGGGADNEVITFNRVYYEEMNYSEGDETNTLEFSGVDHETAPTIT